MESVDDNVVMDEMDVTSAGDSENDEGDDENGEQGSAEEEEGDDDAMDGVTTCELQRLSMLEQSFERDPSDFYILVLQFPEIYGNRLTKRQREALKERKEQEAIRLQHEQEAVNF